MNAQPAFRVFIAFPGGTPGTRPDSVALAQSGAADFRRRLIHHKDTARHLGSLGDRRPDIRVLT
jgi:hypothetical protein